MSADDFLTPASIEAGTRAVDLGDVHRDPSFQVRKVHAPTVNQYRTMLAAGQQPPPVILGRIDGVLTLLCGWHREAAARDLPIYWEYPAVIVETTAKEARWIAARDNLGHGRPYSRADRRRVFRAFVRAGEHRKPSGRLLSYDAIVSGLGGIAVKSTVREWMRKDFPSVAAAMGGYEELKGTRGVREPRAVTAAEAMAEHIQQAQTCVGGIRDPVDRHACCEAARALLEALEAGGPVEAPDF